MLVKGATDNPQQVFGGCTFKITTLSPMDQWVKRTDNEIILTLNCCKTHWCSRKLRPRLVSSLGHISWQRVGSPAVIPWSSCSAVRMVCDQSPTSNQQRHTTPLTLAIPSCFKSAYSQYECGATACDATTLKYRFISVQIKICQHWFRK